MRTKKEHKHVSFRMPVEVHADYVMVAESRGVDLSALLNWVVTEAHPHLLLCHALASAAMLRVRAAELPPNLGDGEGPAKVLRGLEELIQQLQGVVSNLSAQIGTAEPETEVA